MLTGLSPNASTAPGVVVVGDAVWRNLVARRNVRAGNSRYPHGIASDRTLS